MLKTHTAALLVATALVSGSALAQTSTAPATTTAPVTTPAAPAGSTMGTNPSATTGAGSFITQREPGMYRASELIGTDVRGANNEDIGEVGDVLIDRNGQVRAVVVDIGGFLGIGETHIALPLQAVQFRSNQQNAATTGAVGGATGTTGSTGTNQPGTTAGTGSTGQTMAARTDNQAGAANNANRPDMIIVMMTKEQLQGAPKFQDNTRRTGGTTGAGSTGTGTTAPRQ